MKDIYASVTNQIIRALEAGTPPWAYPWRRSGSALPRNAASQRPYRGINVLLLHMQASLCGYVRHEWLTFNQARQAGGHVRRGEEGCGIVFFKLYEVDEPPATNEALPARVVPLLRSFTVFNVAQIDGLPGEMAGSQPEDPAWDPLEAAEAMLVHSGARIRHGGDRAFYRPKDDVIQLPGRGAFAEAGSYYGVALHELTHWTGHEARCNRVLAGRPNISAYAFEELVAEIGSAFLCGHCGLNSELQHASYVAEWLKALRNDKRLVFTAAAQAQKAADFVLALAQAEQEVA